MIFDYIAIRAIFAGLLVVHALWAAAFLIGALSLRALSDTGAARDGAFERGLDFIVATALGLSVIIFGTYVLGTLGLLNWIACSVLYILILAGLYIALRSRGQTSADMRAAIMQPLSAVKSRVIAVVYVIAVFESAPAILPPVLWDSTMYHLANAVNWAHTGHIYTDTFLRTPYFAYNFELLYALAFAYHLDRFVLFIGWLPFVCSAIAIAITTRSFVSRFILPGPNALRTCNIIGLAAAVSFLASPLVLRYALSGYVDVAIGFFLLATTIALMRSLDRFKTYAIPAAIIAGTFIGMKLQLVSFLPILVFAILYTARASRIRIRTIVSILAVLGVFAAPWFARNAILTGDPISPVINNMLGHSDPIFSRTDYAGIQWNLHQAPGNIFTAPVDFALNKPFLDEAGSSWDIAFVGLLPLAALVLFIRRRPWRVDRQIILLSAILGYSIIAIALVSVNIERYALTYFALLPVALALGITACLKWLSVRRQLSTGTVGAVSTILLLVFALPSPMNALAYQSYSSQMSSAELGALRPEQYIAQSGSGLYEAADLAALVASSHVAGRTLAVGFENTAYYFRAADVSDVGDWFGPGRYSDLEAAIRAKAVPQYLERFQIDSVMIGKRNVGWTEKETSGLMNALHDARYVDVSLVDDTIHELLRPDVAARVNPALLTARPRLLSERSQGIASLDLLKAFPLGSISSTAKVATPTGTAAFLYQWPRESATVQTVTIISGFSYRYAHIHFGKHSVLSVDVEKPLEQGKAAIAWVDVTVGTKTQRILQQPCEPRSDRSVWKHLEATIPFSAKSGSITFGVSSEPDGGIADWIAFAAPRITDASAEPVRQ